MRVVYKYALQLGKNEIYMPEDSELLTFQTQDNRMFIWAVVYTMLPDVVRKLNVRGTGQELSDNEQYIGTLQDPPFVWHLFEEVQMNKHTEGMDLNDE